LGLRNDTRISTRGEKKNIGLKDDKKKTEKRKPSMRIDAKEEDFGKPAQMRIQ